MWEKDVNKARRLARPSAPSRFLSGLNGMDQLKVLNQKSQSDPPQMVDQTDWPDKLGPFCHPYRVYLFRDVKIKYNC
jgi:hypothetical protein